MLKKQLYAAPETEVLELSLEGNVLQTGSSERMQEEPEETPWD